MQRQREKEDKAARKQEEKEHKKSQSRTRTSERDLPSLSNNRSKAKIILLDDTEQYVDVIVRDLFLHRSISTNKRNSFRKMIREKRCIFVYVN